MCDGEDETVPKLPGTCPNNIRFSQCNQSYHCFTMFYHYMKCIRLFNEGHENCEYFQKCAKCLCPNAWIDRWVEQIEAGTFPRDLPDCHKD